MSNPQDPGENQENQGEGNREADRNYRRATRRFVESARGQKEMNRAGDVSADEEKDLREAEDAARARAKEQDPSTPRDYSRPS